MIYTNAVIDQLILGRLVPRESKILAGGISRGGFLSLILAGELPKLVKGVVNFVGGWYGVTDRLSETENKQRMDDQFARLARAAKQTRAASVWFYIARDPLYSEGVPRELFRSWQDAGGRGEFFFINDHSLSNPHVGLASNAALWSVRSMYSSRR